MCCIPSVSRRPESCRTWPQPRSVPREEREASLVREKPLIVSVDSYLDGCFQDSVLELSRPSKAVSDNVWLWVPPVNNGKEGKNMVRVLVADIYLGTRCVRTDIRKKKNETARANYGRGLNARKLQTHEPYFIPTPASL